ncbi:MAG: DUF4956 domain-containing protein [Planctomycetia bacterium]|nr:DUF4956 domain-containing protein [Planctomycetia bacterium]
MPEWLQQAASGEGPLPWTVFLARLSVAFAYGWLAAGIHYIASGRPRRRTDRGFLATLVLLSVLIALVTLVIGDNVARAFSLVGSLAIVRFRTVVEDTRDTSFVIFAVVMGMAAGTGYWSGPLICAPFVLVVAWAFRPKSSEEQPGGEGLLVLRCAAGRPADNSLEKVLDQYVAAHRLTGLATVRGGSALEVTYTIRMRGADQTFGLVADLNRLEGVQGVEIKGN